MNSRIVMFLVDEQSKTNNKNNDEIKYVYFGFKTPFFNFKKLAKVAICIPQD